RGNAAPRGYRRGLRRARRQSRRAPAHQSLQLSLVRWGPRMAPQTPQRSSRSGGAVARLDFAPATPDARYGLRSQRVGLAGDAVEVGARVAAERAEVEVGVVLDPTHRDLHRLAVA